MAHHKRKRPRSHMGQGSSNDIAREMKERGLEWRWYQNTPSSHHIVFHHRPKRRETKRLLTQILKGEDPEKVAWPVARKPHIYYW